jgi:hypothetical protein
MNVIMLGGPLIYCTLLFSFDFYVYLTGSSIYVYMTDLVDGLSSLDAINKILLHVIIVA